MGLWGDWIVEGNTKGAKRERQYFKAVFQPEWAEGLANKIMEEFGTQRFTYIIYCARKDGPLGKLESLTVADNPVKVVDFASIIQQTVERIGRKTTGSVEPTTLGRFIQLLRHARVTVT